MFSPLSRTFSASETHFYPGHNVLITKLYMGLACWDAAFIDEVEMRTKKRGANRLHAYMEWRVEEKGGGRVGRQWREMGKEEREQR